jgi:hypothetical protein
MPAIGSGWFQARPVSANAEAQKRMKKGNITRFKLQKEAHALQQTASLFDHLVSTQQGRSAVRAPTERIRALLKSDGE